MILLLSYYHVYASESRTSYAWKRRDKNRAIFLLGAKSEQ